MYSLAELMAVLYALIAITIGGFGKAAAQTIPKGEGIDIRIGATGDIQYHAARVAEAGCAEAGYKPWEIIYTQEMRQVAAFEDAAIHELSKIVNDVSRTRDARLAAVQAIHLIGLKGIVYLEQYEDFRSEVARQCIIEFLRFADLRLDVIQLLMRDPWETDVPHLLRLLGEEQALENYWGLVKILQRYDIKTRPLNQSIPVNFPNGECKFSYDNSQEYFSKAFYELKTKSAGRIKLRELQTPLVGIERPRQGFYRKTVIELVSDLTRCGFNSIGHRIEYYLDSNGDIILCDCKTARERWLEWSNENVDAIRSTISPENEPGDG